MAQERYKEALLGALCASQGFITYQPLRGEVDFRVLMKLPTETREYCIAPRASLNPSEELLKAQRQVGTNGVCIFLPGRSFDTLGTRHGQGGGWYDRFLAAAPVEWLRVGFCFEHQLSSTPLTREPWDEPVDIVCVATKEGAQRAVFETRARMPAFDTL